jgi:hypothetical protein
MDPKLALLTTQFSLYYPARVNHYFFLFFIFLVCGLNSLSPSKIERPPPLCCKDANENCYTEDNTFFFLTYPHKRGKEDSN